MREGNNIFTWVIRKGRQVTFKNVKKITETAGCLESHEDFSLMLGHLSLEYRSSNSERLSSEEENFEGLS